MTKTVENRTVWRRTLDVRDIYLDLIAFVAWALLTRRELAAG